MALHSEGRRQEYSVLPGTELFPLQDLRLEDPNSLPAERFYLPSTRSRESIIDSRYKAADGNIPRHDYGGFATVPELSPQDDVQESDETCPLYAGLPV